MEKLLNLVISGTVTGAIYSVMAAGLVLTYQTSGIFNFAHGAIAFATAYFYYQLNTGQGWPIVPSALLAILVFAPLLGILLDRILLRRLAKAPVYARIVGTIGLLVALPALCLWLVEQLGNKIFDLDLPETSDLVQSGGRAPGLGPRPAGVVRPLEGVNINTDQLAVFAAAALAAVLLWFVLRKTRIGLQMRAVVDRENLATLRGINPARTSRVAWILTMLLAGLGGVLISPLFSLSDVEFTLVVLGSLAAVALSGLRSIVVAFVGGLALGVFQNLVAGYADDFLPDFLRKLSGFRSSIPFILTLVLLFFIGRDRGREAGSVADEAPATDHRTGLPAWRRRLPWAVFTVALLAFALQWIDVSWLQADPYEASLIATGLCMAVIFLSFVVVTGLGGMVSLAQATFVTTGGFIAGWALNRDWGVDLPFVASGGRINFAWAAIIGALGAAALGALVAIPVRRLGAVALALGTFALAFVADLVPFGVESISHGSFGWSIPAPSLNVPVVDSVVDWFVPGEQDRLDFSQAQQQVVLLLVLFGVLALVLHSLQRSASGRAMLAVRSTEVAARTSGLSPARAKISIFALSAAIAGFGGAMLGMVSFSITRSTAPPLIGLIWLAVAVTFGVRRPGGALLAGLVFACSQTIFQWIGDDVIGGEFSEVTSNTTFVSILFGLGAINLAKNPDGLLALIGHERLEKRRAKQRQTMIDEAEAALHEGEVPEHEKFHHGAPRGDGDTSSMPASSASNSALSLRGIVAGYGEVEVLHGVDVEVGEGRVVALLGANGAGKSTLCAVAAGLLEPTNGAIFVEGTDVTAHAAYQRTHDGILLVPEARGIFPGLNVEENLSILLKIDVERAKAYKRFPILSERRKQLAGSLSGGEQQMLSLAPALAKPPKVFIADEPTLGLAPLAAEEVVRALRELRDLGSAILLVDEKAREAMELADEVAFLELGRVVWAGPRDEVDDELLAASYLGARGD